MIWRVLGNVVGLLFNLVKLLLESLTDDRTLLGIGVTALAAAVGVVFLPLPEEQLRPLVASVAGPTAVVAVAGLAGVLTVWSLRGDVVGETEEPWQPERTPERSYSDARATVGASVDDALGLGDDLTLPLERRASRRGTARFHVIQVAVAVITAAENCSEGEARESLRDGSWTDDPRAAALFAHSGDDHVPLWTRVRDWVRGETFDRRVEHAVREIESYDERANAGPDDERGRFARDDADVDAAALLNAERETMKHENAEREALEDETVEPSETDAETAERDSDDREATDPDGVDADDGDREEAEPGRAR